MEKVSKELLKIIAYPLKMIWSIFDNDAHRIVSKKGFKKLTMDIKPNIKLAKISTMTDSERHIFLEQHKEQVANWLEVIEYLKTAQHTKAWHEQVDELMKKFTITKK